MKKAVLIRPKIKTIFLYPDEKAVLGKKTVFYSLLK